MIYQNNKAIANSLASTGGVTQQIPEGAIIIWSGSVDNIPEGWHVCDGTDGTADLRDRFVLGAGTLHTIGEKDGTEEVELTINQMPKHSHSLFIKRSYGEVSVERSYLPVVTIKDKDWTMLNASTALSNAYDAPIAAQGSSRPHTNMPPYYVLLYIQKMPSK